MVSDRIRYVTGNFYQLQGLRLVPLGLFLLAGAAATAGWLDWLPGMQSSTHRSQWRGGALFATLIACALTSLYYRNRYGAVSQFTRRGRDALIGVAIVVWLVLMRVDGWLPWPILLNALFVALCLVITVWADGRVRRHYLVGAMLWLAMGFLPALGVRGQALLVALYAAGGLTLVVCGLGDHLLITRTLTNFADASDGLDPAIV